MAADERWLRSHHAVLPEGVRPVSILMRGGRVAAIEDFDHPLAGQAPDPGETWLLPGLVDTHVHMNEPGRTDWEGFAHATRAAAAGGITTLVDMPLNSTPATTTRAALAPKREAARGQLHVDVGFWGGLVPGDLEALAELAADGVLGFKCFLAPSGVDDFGHVGRAELERAAPELVRLGLPLLAHAEDPGVLAMAATRLVGCDPRRYAHWLEARPPAAEVASARLLGELALRRGLHVHVVHVASSAALTELTAWRARKAPLTLETCPHYLLFEAEAIADGATAFKCAPPIRVAAHRDALWHGLLSGEIQLVASDHSPCPPALKQLESGDFFAAWGGIASLQVGLPAMWHEAHLRGIPLGRLVEWLAAAPSRLAGLDERKGAIALGMDADLVVFDPDATWRVEGARLQHRHPLTPYEGREVRGRVLETWLRGTGVFEYRAGQEWFAPPAGTTLTRAVERPPGVG